MYSREELAGKVNLPEVRVQVSSWIDGQEPGRGRGGDDKAEQQLFSALLLWFHSPSPEIFPHEPPFERPCSVRCPLWAPDFKLKGLGNCLGDEEVDSSLDAVEKELWGC